MTEKQEKFVQLVGRGSGWMAVLGVVTLAVDAWKHPAYPSGFALAVDILMRALSTLIMVVLWAMFRHPDALDRALRPRVFGLFRPLAMLILLLAFPGFLTWCYFQKPLEFADLLALVFIIGAAGLAQGIWLFRAHPEKLLRRGKPYAK